MASAPGIPSTPAAPVPVPWSTCLGSEDMRGGYIVKPGNHPHLLPSTPSTPVQPDANVGRRQVLVTARCPAMSFYPVARFP